MSAAQLEAERGERIEYIASSLLSRAAVLVRLLVKQVRIQEISRTEGEVLGILSDGPRRITELAELEGVAQPTMTLMIKRLEDRGWVERAGLPQDGRVVMAVVTDSGRAVFEAFALQFRTAMRTDLEGLSDAELGALSAATETLGKFVDVLQRTGW
jgi:DNA-binding MarR family transcriptional regulator